MVLLASLSSCKTETIIQNTDSDLPNDAFYRPPRVLLINMDDVSSALMDTLCTYLSSNYSFQVNTMHRQLLNHKRNLNTDSALTWLKNLKFNKVEYVVGITQKNLIRNYPNSKKRNCWVTQSSMGM